MLISFAQRLFADLEDTPHAKSRTTKFKCTTEIPRKIRVSPALSLLTWPVERIYTPVHCPHGLYVQIRVVTNISQQDWRSCLAADSDCCSDDITAIHKVYASVINNICLALISKLKINLLRQKTGRLCFPVCAIKTQRVKENLLET